MANSVNLANRIDIFLPRELGDFTRLAGEVAQKKSLPLYLVGGVVRDMFLGRRNLDLDLVAEGDAIGLAEEIATLKEGRLVAHRRFGTATVKWSGLSADFAAARSERYERPGALPEVKPGDLRTDLFRRDFTINAMAVDLRPDNYGELVDKFRGLADLESRLIRVLHDRSFVDDATRMWRAIRYEQRLGFTLERETLDLLENSLEMLDTISGDRIRRELELVLEEDEPEKAVYRAGELGVLARLHPSLKADAWLLRKYARAKELTAPEKPSMLMYLALLAYRFSDSELDRFIGYLRFNKATSSVLRQCQNIKAELGILAEPSLKPGGIYLLLRGYSPLALSATAIAEEPTMLAERINLFLDKLRFVKTHITGADLAKRGLAGPQISQTLDMLRRARLDGNAKTREDEERIVRGAGSS